MLESTGSENLILSEYARHWRLFHQGLVRLNSLCMYVNKVIEKLRDQYLPDKKMTVLLGSERCEVRVRTVEAMGLNLWMYGILDYLKAQKGNVLVRSILQTMAQLRSTNRISFGDKASESTAADLEASIKSYFTCDPKEFLGPYPVPYVEEDAEMNEPVMTSIKTYYEEELEGPCLAETRLYYQRCSQEKISGKDITAYIRFAEQQLRQEIQMAKTLFPISSSTRIISAVEEELVLKHMTKLQSDFINLLDRQIDSDLEIVYRLLKRIPDGIAPLSKCYEDFVARLGHQKLEELKGISSSTGESHHQYCTQYVGALGTMLRSRRQQVNLSFGDDEYFSIHLDRAFTAILSLPVPGCPWDAGTVLAEFMDLLFRNEIETTESTGLGKEGEESLFKQRLSDVLALIKLLGNRDSFVETATAKLAARLLYKLSHNGTAELETIRALGQIVGQEARVRWQKMTHDVVISHRFKDHFEQHLMERSLALPCQMNVMIPSYIVWPLPMGSASSSEEVSATTLAAAAASDPAASMVPRELHPFVQHFTNCYRRHHPNRSLTWFHYLSRIVLNHVNDAGKSYELICTLPQAALLLNFQTCNQQPLSELLGSLSSTQMLLVMEPMLRAGLLSFEGDIVRLNENWKGTRSRVCFAHHSLISSVERDLTLPVSPSDSIPSNLMAIDQSSDIGGDSNLSEQRKYLLQCIVVKCLKKHQQLALARLGQLVEEATMTPGPLAFHPTPEQLRLTLERLEEKQYIEYDAKKEIYVYIP